MRRRLSSRRHLRRIGLIMKKFTIIDYIIIILVICAVIFAFIHITSDDSSDLQKTAFDESTVNKIPDTYLKYYKEGYIVNATLEGFNSTNGQEVSLSGNVIWEDDNGGGDVKLLIESQNETYSAGLYRYNPNVDIYIDRIILESNGEKYKNLTEIIIKPMEITSLNDLIKDIDNGTNFEITTKVSIDDLATSQIQKIKNVLSEKENRISVKPETSDMDNQLVISRATKENINDADSALGNINGISEEITIRIYDSTDKQIDNIKNKYDVMKIKTF